MVADFVDFLIHKKMDTIYIINVFQKLDIH